MVAASEVVGEAANTGSTVDTTVGTVVCVLSGVDVDNAGAVGCALVGTATDVLLD